MLISEELRQSSHVGERSLQGRLQEVHCELERPSANSDRGLGYSLQTPGAVRDQSGGPLSLADNRALLVLISEAIRRPKGGGLDVPRHSQRISSWSGRPRAYRGRDTS